MSSHMRVLVTGWAGYIGPAVVRALRNAGHFTLGLDTGWFAANWAEPLYWPLSQWFGDIRDFERFVHPEDVPDAIVHLAGLSNDPLGELRPPLTHEINVKGTQRLLNVKGPKHIFASSCAVYGVADVATEETPVMPQTAYAESKAWVDKWLPEGACSLRFSTAWGYTPGLRTDLVLNAWEFNKPDRLRVSPARRSFVHVEDIADAVVFALDHDLSGIYNVVGENWTIPDLAEYVRPHIGSPPIEMAEFPDPRSYFASGEKLYAAGWQPARLVEADFPALAATTVFPREYGRLAAIKALMASGRLDADLRWTDVAAPLPLRLAENENETERVFA